MSCGFCHPGFSRKHFWGKCVISQLFGGRRSRSIHTLRQHQEWSNPMPKWKMPPRHAFISSESVWHIRNYIDYSVRNVERQLSPSYWSDVRWIQLGTSPVEIPDLDWCLKSNKTKHSNAYPNLKLFFKLKGGWTNVLFIWHTWIIYLQC